MSGEREARLIPGQWGGDAQDLGAGASVQSIISQEGAQTESSTSVCLSLLETDAAQAAMLARLEPGGKWGSLDLAKGQPWQALCAWA